MASLQDKALDRGISYAEIKSVLKSETGDNDGAF